MIVLTAPFPFLLAAVLIPVALRSVEAVASGRFCLCCMVTEAAALHAAPTNILASYSANLYIKVGASTRKCVSPP